MIKIKILIVTLFAFSLIANSQTTYYIDYTEGLDSNSGTNETSAWKTLNKVNSSTFQIGDSILFKCGETWRGQLLPKSGNSTSRLVYSSYGNGDLPQLQGSYNMNLESDWIVHSEDIWICTTQSPTDVGNIIFDNEDHAGIKKIDIDDLHSQDDYYYKINSNELYIFS